MRKKTFLIAIVFMFCIAIQNQCAAVIFNDGEVHTIDYVVAGSVDVYDGPGPEFPDVTTVNLLDGGYIGGSFELYENSHASITGGTVEEDTELHDNSRIHISGGQLTEDLELINNSLAIITGGFMRDSIETYENSRVIITGGTLGMSLRAYDNSRMTLYGTDFRIDGVPVGYGQIPVHFGMLAGTLASGESIIGTLFDIGFGASIILAPKPANIIYVDANAPGLNNGSSWADAYNFLQDALTFANFNPDVNEIRVAQGTYKPDQGAGITTGDRKATFQLINSLILKGGYAGFGEPDPNARDIEFYETILSGDLDGNDVEVNDPCDLLNEPTRAENSYHIVTGSGTDETAVLDGFTITGGSAADPVNKILENYWGAGMSNRYGNPTVNNCTFSINLARNGGGGMDNFNSSPTVTNCSFSANATRGGASGMQNRYDSSPMVTNCTFSENYSVNHGAAMRNDFGSSPTLLNCLFNRNLGRLGAAMYNSSYLGASDPMLFNCTFSANASVLYGGGIHIRDGSSPTLVNCILWNNSDSTGTGESAQIYIHLGDPLINYSCIQEWTGALGGVGNIGYDPLFANAENADYHLHPSSPCIDTGDPNYLYDPNETDLDGRPRVIGGRIDMGAYESPLPAEVRIVPRTINLTSMGNWITCYISLPEDYNVADIDPNRVFLEHEIKAESLKVDEEQQVATARFTREDVQEILTVGDVELTITGQLKDGTLFEGTDTIKVIEKAGQN